MVESFDSACAKAQGEAAARRASNILVELAGGMPFQMQFAPSEGGVAFMAGFKSMHGEGNHVMAAAAPVNVRCECQAHGRMQVL